MGILLDKDLEQIQKIINKEHIGKVTKIQLFDLLAEFTYNHYSDELGDIKKIFPTPLSIIENWETKYVSKKESNIGKEIEQVIVAYSKEHGIISTPLRGRGVDIMIGGKELEVKSSSRNQINTMLQTSFYKNDTNKFYAFVSNTSSNNISIRIVSSQLLHKLSLGDDIINEICNATTSDTLNHQIKQGLDTLDFPHFIETSITKGESAKTSKSFYVGKNVKIRFSIYIEPK